MTNETEVRTEMGGVLSYGGLNGSSNLAADGAPTRLTITEAGKTHSISDLKGTQVHGVAWYQADAGAERALAETGGSIVATMRSKSRFGGSDNLSDDPNEILITTPEGIELTAAQAESMELIEKNSKGQWVDAKK